MKLYYSPGACALHPQIALREAGLPFELVRVDLRSHQLADGTDFYAINPKGYIPLLELDDGTRISEGAVIDQYVADRSPAAQLLPPAGTIERVRAQEWLHFIATELHKQFAPLWYPNTAPADKEAARQRLRGRFGYIAQQLRAQPFLLGAQFSVADGYLFNMLQWARHHQLDLSALPELGDFHARVSARPAVQSALAAETAS